MEVACGQCLGCRLDRSRMWAMRISHEASLHKDTNGNAFVTLTYDQDHIPQDWSLSAPKLDEDGNQIESSHFQKFIKKLRKTTPNKIKYYAAGEYGNHCRHGIDLEKVGCPLCNLGRPHYHACLFNISFDDLQPYKTERDRTYYTSPELTEIWGKGFVDVGKLEYQSAAYVARYIMKKINGVNAPDHYQNIGASGEITSLTPEYATMSKGIGKDWFKKYGSDVFPSDETPVPGQGVIKTVPRYYENLYKIDNEEELEEIKEKRQDYKRRNWQEFESERLYSKYRVKKAQTTNLSRN